MKPEEATRDAPFALSLPSETFRIQTEDDCHARASSRDLQQETTPSTRIGAQLDSSPRPVVMPPIRPLVLGHLVEHVSERRLAVVALALARRVEPEARLGSVGTEVAGVVVARTAHGRLAVA